MAFLSALTVDGVGPRQVGLAQPSGTRVLLRLHSGWDWGDSGWGQLPMLGCGPWGGPDGWLPALGPGLGSSDAHRTPPALPVRARAPRKPRFLGRVGLGPPPGRGAVPGPLCGPACHRRGAFGGPAPLLNRIASELGVRSAAWRACERCPLRHPLAWAPLGNGTHAPWEPGSHRPVAPSSRGRRPCSVDMRVPSAPGLAWQRHGLVAHKQGDVSGSGG